MNDVVESYAERLENALVNADLDADLNELTSDWTHPYLRDVPNGLSVEDVKRLRRLQRRMIDGGARTYFDRSDIEFLTAGMIGPGSLKDRWNAVAMRSAYKDLPEVEATARR
jgi:hypothetical protein